MSSCSNAPPTVSSGAGLRRRPVRSSSIRTPSGRTGRSALTIVNGTIARMLAAGELQKLYEKWITPYGVPIEGELDALFKIEAIAE